MIGPAECGLAPETAWEEAAAEMSQRFEALALPFRPQLYRKALQLTRDPDDAEDLVQETLLRAFRFFHSFRKQDRIQSWLYKIQKSIFINQYRRNKVRHEAMPMDRSASSDELNVAGEDRLHEVNPRDRIRNKELDEEMEVALMVLPDFQRRIFLLAAFRGDTYEEMADRFVCPVGTVRSRLSRARNTLRRRLVGSAQRYGFIRN
jgi:RNA polymerase sigma-70 factor, ECF subfamily